MDKQTRIVKLLGGYYDGRIISVGVDQKSIELSHWDREPKSHTHSGGIVPKKDQAKIIKSVYTQSSSIGHGSIFFIDPGGKQAAVYKLVDDMRKWKVEYERDHKPPLEKETKSDSLLALVTLFEKGILDNLQIDQRHDLADGSYITILSMSGRDKVGNKFSFDAEGSDRDIIFKKAFLIANEWAL